MRAIGLSSVGVVLIAASALFGQTPESVIQFLRTTATDLANGHGDHDAQEFLDHFDSSMPDYVALHDAVEELVARSGIGSAVEIVTDAGDDKKRTLELDWVLEVEDQLPRRKVLKVTIEKKGKHWKFTSLEPVAFFKYDLR
jgi:hypothetical protein